MKDQLGVFLGLIMGSMMMALGFGFPQPWWWVLLCLVTIIAAFAVLLLFEKDDL